MARLQSYLFVCLFSFFIQIDGRFLTIQHLCYFRGEDPLDVEYIYRIYGNRVKVLEYNSTLNRFTGYTPNGTDKASTSNQNQVVRENYKSALDFYCKHYGPLVYDAVLMKTVKPYAHLRTEKNHSDRHPTMLKCSAYKFYPRKIRVTWLRDGQEVPMSSTEELANGDWYYQIHSYLEFTPTPGEISCRVEHPSLTEPMILHWDEPLPGSERSEINIGVSGLVLGLVFAAAGLIYYNRLKATVHYRMELVETCENP